ncbi:MAG: hypothetical protein DYG96_14555 [Chlorobi bacterium CHB2]|nr:hypothetical protein [Chlorobi bacterium CHB2]
MRGRTDQITVMGPEEPVLIEHNGTPLTIHRRESGSRFVELPRKHPVLLTILYRGMHDTVVLEPKGNPNWIAWQIPLLLGFATMADVTTGSWKSFKNTSIFYGTTDTAERLQGSRMAALRGVQLHLLDTLRQPDTTFYRPNGIYFYLALTPNPNPENGLLSLFSMYSVGCIGGYVIRPEVSVGLGFDNSTEIDYSNYEGSVASIQHFTETEWHYNGFGLYELDGFFAGIHGGVSQLSADSIFHHKTKQRINGYHATMLHVGWSLGYRWDFGFMEYRTLYGTGTIRKPDQTTESMIEGTFRCGIGFSF